MKSCDVLDDEIEAFIIELELFVWGTISNLIVLNNETKKAKNFSAFYQVKGWYGSIYMFLERPWKVLVKNIQLFLVGFARVL